jgi:hypothetical protein
MRIWDVEPQRLCRNHLLGEHRELHAIWSIITKHKKGYINHPETKRWKGKLKALYLRHERLVKEMSDRGYCHRSCLDKRSAKGLSKQNFYINSLREQWAILRNKHCACRISSSSEDHNSFFA